MSWSRPELVALMLIAGLGCSLSSVTGSGTGSANGSVTTPEQQLELKLSALRVHRQLLQTEIARLYMGTFSPETPILLEELQQRQQDVQLQIETLEGKAHEKDAQHLAISLAADFEYLQHKLDELKTQLQQLDAMQGNNHNNHNNHNNNNNNSSNNNMKHPVEAQRDDIQSSSLSPSPSPTTTTTSAGSSSYFWTPLLAMPEYPSGSIKQPAANSPSLIKRLLSILRPNASSTASSSSGFLRGHWLDSSSNSKHKLHLLSADELLPQLQLQRQFLDDAITRLEQLDAKKSDSNV